MNQKITQLLAPRFGLYFLIMVIFAAVTAYLDHVDVAVAELIVVALLYAVYLVSAVRRKRTAADYLKEMVGSLDDATRDSALNCPLPVVMFRPDTDEVLWSSDRFLRISGGQEGLFHTRMADLVPGFSTRWLLEGKSECPEEVTLNGRRYQVFGSVSRPSEKETDTLATTYWLDVTDLANTRDIYKATRPVVAVLLLDNYEDTIKSQEDSVRNAMLAEINQRFTQWVGNSGGIFCRLDRDRYLFIFEEQYLESYKAEKFSILDTVRTVQSPNGIPVTLSIGIGIDGDTPAELFKFATLSAEMALSRGGDQAVIKNRFAFEFYGGRAKETEKRTKVKSRVMASALGSLVSDASSVMVMGHSAADMDAVGAAVGVCAIARKRGVPAYIIREGGPTPADDLYERVAEMDYYRDRFLGSQEALLQADSRTLLVVVDTNRPEQVSSQELLTSCTKVAVIDHHRRAATYIEGAALNFHEPSASSASELVSELLGYLLDPGDLMRGEAEAMLAGIMLDTKNFTMRTGSRTFEAAAYLRRCGGDTGEVKKLFQTGLTDTIAKYDIIQNARTYRGNIAIAPVPHAVGRVAAAQAADELLNIAGISASFVLYQDGEQVILSARSIDDINVQVIAEALGGGGNAAAAGAQLSGQTLDQVTDRLVAALDSYFSEDSGGEA
ncbi:MAG: DHH family phosphoesterase [Candidatus Enterenecus sp.]